LPVLEELLEAAEEPLLLGLAGLVLLFEDAAGVCWLVVEGGVVSEA